MKLTPTGWRGLFLSQGEEFRRVHGLILAADAEMHVGAIFVGQVTICEVSENHPFKIESVMYINYGSMKNCVIFILLPNGILHSM